MAQTKGKKTSDDFKPFDEGNINIINTVQPYMKKNLRITIQKEFHTAFEIKDGHLAIHPNVLTVNNSHLVFASCNVTVLALQISEVLRINTVIHLAKAAKKVFLFREEGDSNPENLHLLLGALKPEHAPRFKKQVFMHRDPFLLWQQLEAEEDASSNINNNRE